MVGASGSDRLKPDQSAGYSCDDAMTTPAADSEKSDTNLKQLFHFRDHFSVCNKDNHVIFGFDHGVMVGNHHLMASTNPLAHHGADDGALRQGDLLDATAHHPARSGIAMRNQLERLGRAPTQ